MFPNTFNSSSDLSTPPCFNAKGKYLSNPTNTDSHWYRDVLYKQFLTPFHDGVLNRRQVSVCDRGYFPHDPETVGDRPSGHTSGSKMCSCVIGQGIETQSFPFVCTSHIVNPRKTFPFVCISHTIFVWKHLCKVT